jgi:PqqD family protein of HPr-rel-A system
MTPAVQWSSVDPARRVLREWPDEDQSVVYDTASGDTHLVEALGVEVLQLLDAAPRTAPEMASALAGLFDTPNPIAIVEYITATLQQLQDAGLVASTTL